MAQVLPAGIMDMYSKLSDRDKKHMGLRFKERYNHVTVNRFQAITNGRATDLTLDEFQYVQKLIKEFYLFRFPKKEKA